MKKTLTNPLKKPLTKPLKPGLPTELDGALKLDVKVVTVKPAIKPNKKKAVNSHSRLGKRASWKVMLPMVLGIIFLVWLGLRFNIDEKVIAGVALIFALLTGAFAWVVALITLVPIVGPLVIKILSIPLVWLINGIGYLISYTAIKRGYSKDVLTYRGLTITLIIGIVIGFIIANLIIS